MVDLDEGDFVYQADQELFLVVMDETENGYRFSVHGWREIGDERLERYVDEEAGKLFRKEEVEDILAEEADEDTLERYERLLELFEQYEDIEPDEEGPETDFALEDT